MSFSLDQRVSDSVGPYKKATSYRVIERRRGISTASKTIWKTTRGNPLATQLGDCRLIVGHYERQGEIKIDDTSSDSPSEREIARRKRMKRGG